MHSRCVSPDLLAEPANKSPGPRRNGRDPLVFLHPSTRSELSSLTFRARDHLGVGSEVDDYRAHAGPMKWATTWTRQLDAAGIPVDLGLSEEELTGVEQRFGFAFAPVHRRFLAQALPLGPGWVDWRRHPMHAIQDRLDWPEEGLIFDVLNSDFWPRSWGTRPPDDRQAVLTARAQIRYLPTLVPIYSHRYLPAAPTIEPTPVFSVSQSDVIVYGADLADYLAHEFHLPRQPDQEPAHVPFWSELADGADNDEF